MGIALLALSDLLTPLQSLANRWISSRRGFPGPARRSLCPVNLHDDLRYVQVRPGNASASQARAARPLRVVRVKDADAPLATGRLLLSGRMDEVCAELDRLAALEAAQSLDGPGRLH